MGDENITQYSFHLCQKETTGKPRRLETKGVFFSWKQELLSYPLSCIILLFLNEILDEPKKDSFGKRQQGGNKNGGSCSQRHHQLCYLMGQCVENCQKKKWCMNVLVKPDDNKTVVVGLCSMRGKKRAALKSLEEPIDRDTEMAKLVDQANKLHILRFRNAMKLKQLLVECVAYRRSFIEQRMSSIQFDAEIRKLEADLKQHERSAIEATIQFQNLKKETEACERQLTDSLNQAESIAPLTPELQNEFREMPTTIEDLSNAIQETISEARAIFTLNNNALEEYEYRRQKVLVLFLHLALQYVDVPSEVTDYFQIEELAEKIAAEEEEYGRSSTEIKEIEDKWLPALRNLVALINETFSRNFQEMAVAGEVSLDEHDKEYAQYGICIKVKFRQNGKLEVLSAHHQSGGERSVSTIVYLLSLQDLTNVPFRVVDEINQGMDPINERKMFQQLVRAASKPNTPQCFLLTPKLLPDLQYSEACTILNVFNGPWIPQPSKLWEEGERWSIVTGLLGETHC
ncbi:hypothetical protein Ahy_B08g090309 isoform C [Arachis hypogaea]|uniref:Structural maintenance of chromosomes protein 5 n=1 Tax=Arachis hypogaea TaxID=3818 RepID=A0A444XZZ0_ARAHY|nr:hypothetical protein Ahy_B08g090309 isoform C [Arachis hypogaea]